MQQQLRILCRLISEIDNDPFQCMIYYTGSSENTTIPTKGISNIRWQLITSCLHQAEHILNQKGMDYCLEIDGFVLENIKKLNDFYQKHQHLCWQSHTHHFHASMEQYVNCPITCLCEIEEFVQKLIKEIYQQ